MNNKIIMVLILITIALVSVLVLHLQKYSISDINADNYDSKLTYSKSGNIFSSGIYKMFGDGNIVGMKCATAADGFRISHTNNSNGTMHSELYNLRTHVSYWINWDDQECGENNATNIDVGTFPMGYTGFIDYKNEINKLITEEGFILKKSEKIDGYDVIIYENAESFVVGKIFGKYDGKDGNIQAINFTLYKRNKFF